MNSYAYGDTTLLSDVLQDPVQNFAQLPAQLQLCPYQKENPDWQAVRTNRYYKYIARWEIAAALCPHCEMRNETNICSKNNERCSVNGCGTSNPQRADFQLRILPANEEAIEAERKPPRGGFTYGAFNDATIAALHEQLRLIQEREGANTLSA